MKIKIRLKLNTWISLGALVLVILTFAWSIGEVNRAERNVLLVDEIRKASYERIYLRDDHLLNPNEQTKIRWYAQSETLRGLLESADKRITGPEDRILLQDARAYFEATFSSFSTILEKQKEPTEGKKLSVDEAEPTLISQVYRNAYALNASIVKLHESSRRAAIAVRNRVIIILILFVVGIVIAIALNSIFISRVVTKRVAALSRGVEIIGGGNWDFRIDERGDDELSDLAHASNGMILKLKESQEFAESVINTVREPLISLDQDLRVVTVSRSFYEFFKVKPEETVGQLIYDLGNKQWDIPKLRELLETILPQKAAFDGFEVEHDFAGIGRRVMLLNARQIQRVLGKERIILLAIEDITERKAIEAGLETTRKELAAIKIAADEVSEFAENIINTVREPLLALDQDLRIVKVSRSFYEFFKVKPEETVGQLIYDLGNKQWDIPKLRELLETILPQKASFKNYEVEHDFAGVGKRIMLLNARQIQRVLGKERIILLAIEDITERKAIEAGLETTRKELVKARDAAEASNKELESFSYSVSHDLRTPLRSIDGFGQALLEDYQDKLDDTAKSYLDRMRKATQHLGRLIDDMLKLSRVTRSSMHYESVDLSAMVRDISENLRREDPARKVEVIIREGVFVSGDADLMRIALENLINNAWKFSSKEERPQFEFGTTVKEGKTICFIRDNGVGFDMAYVDKLFGAFQRLHTSLEFPGTGIGLATVRRVINRHGGEVWVEAAVGKGATFYFTIPGFGQPDPGS